MSLDRSKPQDASQAVSKRLPLLAKEIRHAHDAARDAARTSLVYAIEVGEKLIEAKSLVAHGGWLAWLKEHCKLSARSAQNFMKLARNKDRLAEKNETAAHLTVRSALAEIADSRTPQDEMESWAPDPRVIPPEGCMRFGSRRYADETTSTVWVAPSLDHPGFFYVIAFCLPREKDGGSFAQGYARPLRADAVALVLEKGLNVRIDQMKWKDELTAPWAYNLLLEGTKSLPVRLKGKEVGELWYLSHGGVKATSAAGKVLGDFADYEEGKAAILAHHRAKEDQAVQEADHA